LFPEGKQKGNKRRHEQYGPFGCASETKGKQKKTKEGLKSKILKSRMRLFLSYGGNLYAQSSLLKLKILKASLWS